MMFEKMKKVMGALLPALMLTLFTVSASFADGSGAAAAMETAFTPVKTDFLAAVTKLAPIAVAIAATPIVWKLGIKFFKSLTGR